MKIKNIHRHFETNLHSQCFGKDSDIIVIDPVQGSNMIQSYLFCLSQFVYNLGHNIQDMFLYEPYFGQV